MLFPMRPQEGSTLDDVYLVTVAIVTSLQVRYDVITLCVIDLFTLHIMISY